MSCDLGALLYVPVLLFAGLPMCLRYPHPSLHMRRFSRRYVPLQSFEKPLESSKPAELQAPDTREVVGDAEQGCVVPGGKAWVATGVISPGRPSASSDPL